jgi:hypothetical protein
MSEFEFPEEIMFPKDRKVHAKFADYYVVKYDICKSLNPSTIAEIGVRTGSSAWTFLQAVPEAKYVGIDDNNGKHGGRGGEDGRYKRWAEKVLSPYDYELLNINTQKVDSLPLENIDFFHVDGDHSFKGVIHDLNLAFPVLSEKGSILVDDYDYISEVEKGVDKWLEDMKGLVESKYIKSLRGEMLITKV